MSEKQDRVKGAKDLLLNSIMYYRQALLQTGCQDINKEIATEVGRAMMLTQEQTDFIAEAKQAKAKEVIENAEILLKHMVYNDKLDKESITLILKGLKTLKGLVNNESNV